jgi:hypothetical protein
MLLPSAALKGMRGLVNFGLYMGGALRGHGSNLVFAESMPNLTSLDLGSNTLQTIPHFLTQLSCLELLDLSLNIGLQLDQQSVALLKEMPQLRALDISQQNDDAANWTLATFKAINCIRAEMPGLQLILEESDRVVNDFE